MILYVNYYKISAIVFSHFNIMKCLYYFLCCFSKKQQQNEIQNPLHECDSSDTGDNSCGPYYNMNDPIPTITSSKKKVRFSSEH